VDDLQQAQRTLSRTLGKARAGEDRELAQRVRENGEALAQMLAGLLKMTRVHAADNRAFDAPIAEFCRALSALAELVGVVHLVAVEDQAYVNEMRLRSEGRPGLKDLGAELRRHNVGGISFQAELRSEQARALVAGFGAPPTEPYPRTALRSRLALDGVASVQLHGVFRFRTTEDLEGGTADPAAALRRALHLSAEAWDALASGRVFNPLPLRRAVSEILEIGPLSPALWDAWVVGMPRRDHALSVALHALLLGQAVGFPKGVLQDVGVAGLVHDVGYAALGNGPGSAGPEGLARHPGEGARVLLRQRGFSDAKVRRLRAVLDHHRGQAEPRGRPSAVGSILRIAEDYSSFVRVYGQRITQADVLAAMSRAAGAFYHPVLAQLLVNALGRFPPGTLLELADGRRVRSTSPVRSPETFAAPLARFVDPATGEPSGPIIDLSAGPAVKRALPG
jgi:hypothetical protein